MAIIVEFAFKERISLACVNDLIFRNLKATPSLFKSVKIRLPKDNEDCVEDQLKSGTELGLSTAGYVCTTCFVEDDSFMETTINIESFLERNAGSIYDTRSQSQDQIVTSDKSLYVDCDNSKSLVREAKKMDIRNMSVSYASEVVAYHEVQESAGLTNSEFFENFQPFIANFTTHSEQPKEPSPSKSIASQDSQKQIDDLDASSKTSLNPKLSVRFDASNDSGNDKVNDFSLEQKDFFHVQNMEQGQCSEVPFPQENISRENLLYKQEMEMEEVPRFYKLNDALRAARQGELEEREEAAIDETGGCVLRKRKGLGLAAVNCTVCARQRKQFKSVEQVVMHLLAAHGKELPKPFKCAKCPRYATSYSANVGGHLRTIHGVCVEKWRKNKRLLKQEWHPVTLSKVYELATVYFPTIIDRVETYLIQRVELGHLDKKALRQEAIKND